MPIADRLEITHVHASPEGDAVFPPIDPEVWQETWREEHYAGPDDDANFTLATYVRR
jgi:dihydrofolate reductase